MMKFIYSVFIFLLLQNHAIAADESYSSASAPVPLTAKDYLNPDKLITDPKPQIDHPEELKPLCGYVQIVIDLKIQINKLM